MNRIALFILMLCLPLAVRGVDVVSVVVTVTNGVVGNTNTFTLNGSTRTATNSVTASPGTLVRETNSVPRFATNLFVHIGAYPVSAFHIPYLSASNVLNIRGFPGETMTASLAGGWGTIAYVTNTIGVQTFTVRVPHTVEASTNRTNIASMLVSYLDLSTNALGNTSTIGSNYLTLATPQTAPGIKTWTGTNYLLLAHVDGLRVTNSLQFSGLLTLVSNGTWYAGTIAGAASISGTLGSITNGYWTNGIAQNLTVTNLSAPGSGANSLQVGSGASATGDSSTAIGVSAFAGPKSSVAIGTSANAPSTNSVAIGAAASVDSADFLGGVAIGQNASVLAAYGIALGQDAVVSANDTNSVAIGRNATTTKTNQVILGSSTHIVTIPGVLEAAATTNSNWRGTNILNGRLYLVHGSNSSLVNGDNAAVALGDNYEVWLTGPTAAFTIHGVAGGNSDLTYRLVNKSGFPMTIANQSGIEPTAANRIVTGKGANLAVTNAPGSVVIGYDGTASRWDVKLYTD